jgi:hypothetical protein
VVEIPCVERADWLAALASAHDPFAAGDDLPPDNAETLVRAVVADGFLRSPER